MGHSTRAAEPFSATGRSPHGRKPWLESYPPGIEPEVNLEELASVHDALFQTCRKFPNRPALRSLGATLTYAQLGTIARNFAAGLQSLPGLTRGSRIALMMPNVLQYPAALFGVLRAGMVVVNVNPLYTARELEHQLRDSEAEAIVILENFACTLEKALARSLPVRHVITTQIGDLLPAPRRWIANSIVRQIKKLIPPWHILIASRTVCALRHSCPRCPAQARIELTHVVEAAAAAAARTMGQGDATGSDHAAVQAMREGFESVPISGTIVIGEGERDEAPMLYIGERVGARTPGCPEIDIAVDPLEGTNLCATGASNSIAVLAASERGGLLNAPDCYMKKIIAGPACRGALDLDAPVEQNLKAIARCLDREVKDLVIVILDRPRHRN